MASRRLVAAAAAAATSPSPLARLVSRPGRPGLAGPAGRYWPEKVNLWEDPINPMRWKASRGFRRFSTEVPEPVDKAVSGNEVKEPADKAVSGMRMWWHRIKNRIETADMEEKAMAQFVFVIFSWGTPTAFTLKLVRDMLVRDMEVET